MIYRKYGKRLLDICCSAAGLIVLSPLLIAVAAAVKCSSKGPVFFGQSRVGRGGKMFTMWKFRSMVAGAERMGPGITASGDRRVTRVGSYLRRRKLDELPQLWNVLLGDMSLVGPRPELAKYVRNYTSEQQEVLSVRPGITDPASIRYSREEELLATAAEKEPFYVEKLLPQKLALNLEYIRDLAFSYDLSLILRTLRAVPSKPGPLSRA